MCLLLRYFHMYWMLSVLQDIYTKYMGKMIKRRNTGKHKAEKRKEAMQKPTYMPKLG